MPVEKWKELNASSRKIKLKTMKTITLVVNKNENQNENMMHDNVQTMTSLEIAKLTGKQHKNLMQAIRKMEPAWENVCGSNFRLTSRTIVQPNGGTREVPCYQLTKTECLYIATKFNDFDQLIWEVRPNSKWIHVSYKSTGKNRQQVFTCRN